MGANAINFGAARAAETKLESKIQNLENKSLKNIQNVVSREFWQDLSLEKSGFTENQRAALAVAMPILNQVGIGEKAFTWMQENLAKAEKMENPSPEQAEALKNAKESLAQLDDMGAELVAMQKDAFMMGRPLNQVNEGGYLAKVALNAFKEITKAAGMFEASGDPKRQAEFAAQLGSYMGSHLTKVLNDSGDKARLNLTANAIGLSPGIKKVVDKLAKKDYKGAVKEAWQAGGPIAIFEGLEFVIDKLTVKKEYKDTRY